MTNPAFQRYLGIDYSGAATPDSSLKGLRVYQASGDSPPAEVAPPPGPRKYWTRRGLAEWLAERLGEATPSLVGIDHGFSFPLRYFEVHHLEPDWPAFLDDFQRHWPTDAAHTYVDTIRDGAAGNGDARSGSPRWRRIAEQRAGAKSVFHFDVPGSVAKSTHAGLPWLRHLRRRLAGRLHCWPFDGWDIPAGKSALAEVYPSLWRGNFPREDRTPDQHDAWVAAAWLRQADADGSLGRFLKPALAPQDAAVARVEGWILGWSEWKFGPRGFWPRPPRRRTATLTQPTFLPPLRCGRSAAGPGGFVSDPQRDRIDGMKAKYTAVVKESDGWWIGWIEEVPGVNCQEATREELIRSLEVTLREALQLNRSEAIAAAGEGYEELEIAV